MSRPRPMPTLLLAAALAGLAAPLAAQRPARDQPPQPVPAGTAILSGYAVAADTGRPLKRVRIVVSGSSQTGELATALGGDQMMAQLRNQLGPRGGGLNPLRAALGLVRSALTGEEGRYEIRDLPAGKYLVTASKTGFVDVTFGQRRPLRPGTPLDVADGQEIKNVNFHLPRGSVVTGHVLDEDGEPIAQAGVTVMRYQYQSGERRLVTAGSDQTDDRGTYRVYGLPPGDYYVSAVSRLLNRPFERLLDAAGAAPREETFGYAPTFYPGVTTPAEAARVSVGLGQEMGGVDFQLQLVAMARVSGAVLDVDGTPLSGGAVVLVTDFGDAAVRGQNLTGRVGSNGEFTIDNVPPGRYLLWARSGGLRFEGANFAVHSLAVGGQDVKNLVVALSPGATISGSVGVDPASTTAPPGDLSRIRLSLPAVDPVPFGGNQNSEVGSDGRFEITGVPAGRRFIRAPNLPSPWSLKAVIADGRDVTDEPLDVRNGQKITGVQVVLTDRVATLAGTVTDQHNQPALGYTVILFSTDSATWRPQSRTILAVQPDQAGAYGFRGMPPGAYYLAAVDDVERGEWFDPAFLQELQAGAVRVTINEGDTVARDVKVDQ